MGVFHSIYEEKYKKAYEEIKQSDIATRDSLFMSYYTATLSTFKWGKLPEKTLIHQPEEYLIYWGRLAFFKDEEDGEYKMFPAYPCGNLLENGEYSQYTIIARNGTTWIKNRDEIALCYDNNMRLPFIIMIEELSGKSSLALEAVDSSLRKAMMPAIISCKDETQMSAIMDLLDTTKINMPFRVTMNGGFVDKTIEVNNIFDNSKNDILSLWDVYVRYRNFFYTTIGINNVEIQKRERLTQAEGSGNDEITRFTFLSDRYEHRLSFIEEVKNKFNYEMICEINRDSATVYEVNLDNKAKIDNMEIEVTKGANTTINPNGKENDNSED